MFYSPTGEYVTKEVIDLVAQKEELLFELEKVQEKLDELL